MLDTTLVNYVLSYGGAAGLTLILILFGILVPKPYHVKVVEQARKLEEANDVLRDALAEERAQKGRLADSGQLTNQLISALLQQTRTAPPPTTPGQLPAAGREGP